MNAPTHVHLDLELVDLLTGEADADEQRAILTTLRRCGGCRLRADDLAAAMTDAVAAAPAITPPLGFETRVTQRLAEVVPGDRPTTRSLWLRPRWAAAAATVLAIALAVGAVVASLLGDPGGDEPLTLVRNGTDDTVGTVTFATTPDGPVMIVALLDAPADMVYRCRVRLVDGRVVDSPAWPPTRRGAWVLDVPGSIDDIESVEIIADGPDIVWSSAYP